VRAARKTRGALRPVGPHEAPIAPPLPARGRERRIISEQYTGRSCRFGPIRERGSGCRDNTVYQVEEAGGEGGMGDSTGNNWIANFTPAEKIIWKGCGVATHE
jgi:hypothetical protein